MNVFVIVYPLLFTALLGILMASMTSMMPPEIPLGVRVPTAHAGDPVIRSTIRRFRLAQALAWVITAVVTLALAAALPLLAVLIPVLLFVALASTAFVITRRSIVRAKREGAWFDGVELRVRAEVTSPAHHRAPVVWPILSALVLAAVVAIGVAVFPRLPDPYPTHFDAAGQITATAPKTIWSVFGVLMIGAAVALLLAGLSVYAARSSVRPVVGDNPRQATVRAGVQRGVLASLLSELSFVVPLGISIIVLSQWLAPGTFATRAAAILLGLLVVLVVIAAVIRSRWGLRGANERDPQSRAPSAPDDDRHWKGGMIYVNRDDPALLVPKRFGLGWTVNLGRPAGAALTILLLVVLVAGVTTAILAAHGH
ncbi:MAG: DUF5808 domain-containing protein [Actinomycetota bacterium]|nr:DUF5808 domain-containing protein [Actinomycetota bacterium]